MSISKKLAMLAVIIIFALFCVLIYWNQHLYYKAEKIGVVEKKIEILEKAIKFFPLNDLVFYDLGKAYFDLGMNSLDEQNRSNIHLQKSVNYLTLSLRVNPTSYFGHFYLAQSLHNMSFIASSLEEDTIVQYKKAAHLAGENREIHYEIGNVFLSKWQDLSPEDKDFTIEILKKIINRKEKERFRSLLYLWELNIKDYEVIDRILFEDPQIYKNYAEFLGEKSLSLKERQRYLAEAEFLDFQMARDNFDKGKHALLYNRLQEAQNHFQSCQDILNRIHFYQNLSISHELIDRSEYNRLQKLTSLNLLKVHLEQEQDLKDINNYLQEYLKKEDNKAAFEEIESKIRAKGLIGTMENPSFNDLDRLFLEFYLSLKQGKFENIISKGRDLPQRIIALPEGKEDLYVKILGIIAEAFQKVDYIYNSIALYNDAIEIDPDNLEILVKLRKSYERLNSDEELREIKRRIEKIISPQEIDVNRSLNREKRFKRRMIFDGRNINLDLNFKDIKGDREPLISVFFNGRVIWEDYLRGDTISVSLETKAGENVMEVVPVNREVELVKITYE